jgi:hypothetical protein
MIIGLHLSLVPVISFLIHLLRENGVSPMGVWGDGIPEKILSLSGSQWDTTSLFCICMVLGSLVGSRLFSKKEKIDESAVVAWCGALCSQCSHYIEGECLSCPGGPPEIQETCSLFLCAHERGILCSECDVYDHCDLVIKERELCPFGRDFFPFRVGMGYVIYEKNPGTSAHIFRDYIIRGDRGLLVSRRYPDQFLSRYNLEDVAAVWLSTAEGEEKWIDPCNLSKLHYVICDFIKTNPPSMILFEGFEYLMVRNSFMSALKFVQSLMDEIVLSRSKLLLTINPDAFEKKELALVRRELIEWNDQS